MIFTHHYYAVKNYFEVQAAVLVYFLMVNTLVTYQCYRQNENIYLKTQLLKITISYLVRLVTGGKYEFNPSIVCGLGDILIPSLDKRSIAELRRLINALWATSCSPFSFNSPLLNSSENSCLTDSRGGNGGGLRSRGSN